MSQGGVVFQGPFREWQMSVDVDQTVTFLLAEPLSITSLIVTNRHDETVWEIIASEFQPIETASGSFQRWPIEQAPSELLKLLEQVGQRAEQELSDHGPRKPPLSSVTYGVLPSGYREQHRPQPLTSGEYNVIAFGEQGTARASFIIAG
jgi:hypothetical protein